MQSLLGWSVAIFSLAVTCVCAVPTIAETVVHQQFTSQKNNGTKLRYVNDSGVCETTSGVHQVSGYVDIGTNMSIVRAIQNTVNILLMFFLLSGSGSLNLATHRKHLHSLCGVGIRICSAMALLIFLSYRAVNGGPGCSSMIGRQ